MTIGVMSDTHKNIGLMTTAARLMIGTFDVKRIYHLGDDYQDSSGLLTQGVGIVRIPGVYDPEYSDAEIPKRVQDTISGVRLRAAHAEKTLPQNEIDAADIILVGHTHLHEIRDVGKAVLLNPGHLKGASDKGRGPTFGIIKMADDVVHLTIYDLNGDAVETRELKR